MQDCNKKGLNMPLTQIQINTLKSLLDPMTNDELDEAMKLLFDEILKREWNIWDTEITPS